MRFLNTSFCLLQEYVHEDMEKMTAEHDQWVKEESKYTEVKVCCCCARC